MIDPNEVPLEEKLKTIRIVNKMIEQMTARYITPEHVQTMRDYRRVVLDPWEAVKARREARPAPCEHLAETVAAIRTPEEEAELQKVLAEVRAYRGQGRRGWTESDLQQLWDIGMADYRARLLRRADGFEMLATAPGQTPREIVECQRKAWELREAANWRPE